MGNKVLWTLDNETSARTFERLCVDLLYRNGYKKIVPIGGMHDRGRDAEAPDLSGIDATGEFTFFQFSQQKDWALKLRGELRKIRSNGHNISKFVFVTSQDVSGRRRDQLCNEVKKELGWDLVIYSREWLRLQLEEAQPDIAYRHLGIQPPTLSRLFAGPFEFSRPEVEDLQKAWAYFAVGDFERAGSEFRDYLERRSAPSAAWEIFSWCLYETFRYDEALAAINKALELTPDSTQARSIRGCILAERGISAGEKESIKQANAIFGDLLTLRDDGVIHYNYANTLSALACYEEAIRHYQLAAEREPTDPRIWKNLATAYHEVGKHEEEMVCFDRALNLDPELPQALISKGVSLMMDFDKPQEAIELIEQGIRADRALVLRWPPAWHWLGEAYRRIGQPTDGLERVRQGLRQAPGDPHLRRLEFEILSDLWQSGYPSDEPLRYFLDLLADEPRHYAARVEAAKIMMQRGHTDEAWDLLEGVWSAVGRETQVRLRDIGFGFMDCWKALDHLPYYILHRQRYPVRDYHAEGFDGPKNERFGEYLFVSGAITFGLAKGELGKVFSRPEDDKNHRAASIVAVFGALLEKIEHYVALAAGELATELSRDDVEVTSRKLTHIIVFCPEIAAEEWMRQYGWLLASFDIEQTIQDEITTMFCDQSIFSAMLEPILRRVNARAQIFPEDADVAQEMEGTSLS